MQKKISIAGDIGSGKSTVGKILAAEIGVPFISTGQIQRKIAEDRGLSTLELNRLAETDKSIDIEIDNHLRALHGTAGGAIVDSRMAWHFVPESFKIFLYVHRKIAARRLASAIRSTEIYESDSDAENNIVMRRQSEVQRFKYYYDVDISDVSNYDLLVDSSFATPEHIAQEIKRVIERREDNDPASALISPRNLIPTDAADDAGQNAVSVIRFADRFFIHGGHRRVGEALKAGADFVPCRLVAGQSAFLRDAVTVRRIHDWEAAHGFEFVDDAQALADIVRTER